MKPHKHAELIKAWADGATIQFKNREGNWEDFDNDYALPWITDLGVRIKPEPKPDVVKYATTFMTSWHKDKPDTTDNLKLTFDGETDKLKDAVVLK